MKTRASAYADVTIDGPRADASLASMIPLLAYDPISQVFSNEDLSLGIVWELSCVESETADPNLLSRTSAYLESIFKELPEENSALQLIAVSSRDVRDRIRSWADEIDPTAPPIVKDLAHARAQAMEQGRVEQVGGVFAARKLSVYLTLRTFTPLKQWTLLDALSETLLDGHAQKQLEELYDSECARIHDLARRIEQALNSALLGYRRIKGDDVVDLVYSLLNPSHSKRSTCRPTYRAGTPIADLVVRSPLVFHAPTGTIDLDGYKHAVVSVLELPLSTRAGELWKDAGTHPAAVADEMVGVYNIWLPDQAGVESDLSRKHWIAKRHMASSAEATVINQDVEDLKYEIAREGRKVSRVVTTFILRARTDAELNVQCSALESRLRALGYEVKREDDYALPLFLQSLPLCFDPSSDRGMLRGRTLTTLNLAHIVPAYTPMKGTATPDLLIQNRLGEPVTFSFFDTEGSAGHGLILGSSGGGKSFLMCILIMSAIRREARIFIIDKGAGGISGSYRKLCKLLNGLYIQLDANNVQSFNPFPSLTRFDSFAAALDNDTRVYLRSVLVQMVTRGRQDLGPVDCTLLENAIEAVYRDRFDQKSAKPVLISDVHKVLVHMGAQDERSRGLAIALEQWTGDKSFGRYFDRPCTIPEDPALLPRLVVFEMPDKAGWKEVAPTVLLGILGLVERVATREPSRDKYLILDEAWTLLQSRTTADFFTNAAKTYRKLRMALLVVTQQINDLNGEIGEAIKAETQTRISCRQQPDKIRDIVERLELPPAVSEAFATLHKVDGLYSEILLVAPQTCGVARIVPSSLEYWAFTTSAKDNNEVLDPLVKEFQAKRHPDPMRAAIALAAAKYPRGLSTVGSGSGAQGVLREPQDESITWSEMRELVKAQGMAASSNVPAPPSTDTQEAAR